MEVLHLRHPVVTLYHEDPVALHLQDQALQRLQQFIDGVDVGVGQLKAPDLGLSVSWVGQPSILIYTPPGPVLQHPST